MSDLDARVGDDGAVSDPVKIRFALERDEAGWPPPESEGIWALPTDDGAYRLDNIPWFVRGVAAEDVVEAAADGEDVMWFVRVRRRGDRMVIRVIPRDDGPLRGEREAVLDAFAPLGVTGEGMSSPVNMVALDIGPDAQLLQLKTLLANGESDGRWYYEEGSVTDEYRRLP